MYTSFFIAKNNMKKKKSDVAVVTLLIILATMLLYISTSVLGNAGDVVEITSIQYNGVEVLKR